MAALHFEGERIFAAPPDKAWAKLRDAGFLIHCIPDAKVQGESTPDRAQCLVTPNLTFARGQMEVTITIVEAREPTALKFAMRSKGVGNSNQVEIRLELAPHPTGTQVRWVADVTQLGGLLKLVPTGLIRGAAQKVIEDVWNGIAARLAE